MILADISTDIALVISIGMGVLALAGQITTWLTLKSPQKREVTFTGEPVDKNDFEKALRDNKEDHDKLFSIIGGVEREVENRLNHALEKIHQRLNPLEGEICALREGSETNTARLVQMDAKIDRLIERTK
jgi:hypothetical protein